jgi:hypothetical protein
MIGGELTTPNYFLTIKHYLSYIRRYALKESKDGIGL